MEVFSNTHTLPYVGMNGKEIPIKRVNVAGGNK